MKRDWKEWILWSIDAYFEGRWIPMFLLVLSCVVACGDLYK